VGKNLEGEDKTMTESFRERLQLRQKRDRRKDQLILLVIGCLLLFLLGCFIMQSDFIQRRYFYPYPYQSLINKYAREYHIENTLVASVIMNESKFKNEVHSERGAVGLMQLMPDTAKWIAVQIDDPAYNMEKLHEPETNIRYGTWYLASLKKEFEGNDILALAAYNAGRGNVHSWMKKYGWNMNFKNIEQIPYIETREYVNKVLKHREKYQTLYNSD
jgi:soluble lytic murein transglycosylase